MLGLMSELCEQKILLFRKDIPLHVLEDSQRKLERWSVAQVIHFTKER